VPRWLSIALPLAFLAIAVLGNAHAATSSCITMSGFGGSSPLNPGGAAFEPRECFQRSTNRTGPGFAEAAFGGTGYFGGITRVLDDSGGEVQGFSFGGSNAGFTFTQSLVPVPLPPAAWLLACSLVTLACSTRRRI
jgi:hypothetical protein